ncbi:ATP-binding cassette domain-containing protein [Blastococcus sp. BMG 814]|uniref:ATP-binding cassette domain-containing protein n=1 Tax=Blastococcus carthaginiensis TaxID=3050034 RepID=A0ABT9IEX1_9ACTN|nr:oligopeptide/dipeptide ABC transporter ATP-binding protein [Blastococcus carthaginiensis]MDP5184130.1 ATP-binding cassette domain-containing protein [Blastococcus carthaginiensis]
MTAVPTAGVPNTGQDDLLRVEDLKVHFPIRKGIFFDRTVGHVQAVDGVSLTVPRGATYGLVGESGCGKSTLGRAILRLEEPTSGRVLFDGTDVAALKGEPLRQMRQRMQMVFQDPLGSLDPRQNVESLLSEPLRAHGLAGGKAGIAEKIRGLLDAVGLPSAALRRYPHEFSGGQRQRIGIARAVALEPDLLIADEPVSALDVSVQAQVLNLLEELQERLGLTYLVIAHDLAVVRHISDVVGVMYLGSLVEQAPADDLYEQPLHPYTRALMSAVPVPDPEIEEERERILLAGDLPSPADPPSGCRFHTRCPWRQETRCDDEIPVLRELGPGRLVSCHWAEEIRDGVLHPRSPEEVLHAGAATRPDTGGRARDDDPTPFLGRDQPLPRAEQG